MNPNAIPAVVRERDRWLLWDGSAETPRRPHWDGDFGISWNNTDDWHTFEEAVESAEQTDSYGIGYVIQPDDPIYVIDIDRPFTDDGGERDWFPGLDFFEAAGAYIEHSPSTNGIHIPVKGDPPDWWRDCEADPVGHQGVECLSNKFCSFTGDTILNSRVMEINPDPWLKEVYENIRGESPDLSPTGRDYSSQHDRQLDRKQVEEIIDYCDNMMHYKDWYRVGYAVHSWDSGPVGRAVFENWSRKSPKFDSEGERVIEWIWSNADPEKGIGIGTLIHYAKQGGYRPRQQGARANGGVVAAQGGDPQPQDHNQPGVDDLDMFHLYEVLEISPDDVNVWNINNNQLANGIEILLSLQPDAHLRVLDNVDSKDQEIYAMDTATKIWEPKGEQRMGQIARQILGVHNSKNIQNELANALRTNQTGYWLIDRDEFGAPKGHLPVKNGLLNLETREKREPKPDDYMLGRTPTEFDSEETIEGTRFEQFLTQAVSPRDQRKLQEYAGYCLLRNEQPYKKALFLFGPTNSGKGTFIDVITAILGQENVSSESLYSLLCTRWGYHSIYDAWVNASNELTAGGLKNVEKFKTLTGGEDRVTAEDKGVSKYEFTVTQKFIFATNQFPEVEDADKAFFKRCLFVEFPNTVPDDKLDPNLIDELKRERSAILNWMLDGLERLRENGGVFTNERTYDEKRDLTRAFGSPIDQFVHRALTVTDDPAHVVSKQELYAAFTRFCDFIQSDTPTQHAFTGRLKELGGITDGKSRRVSEEGKPKDVYKGAQLNEGLFKKIQADLPTHAYEDRDENQSTL